MPDVLDILIVMNNYLHDVATAVLLSATVIMWTLARRARDGAPGEVGALARAYPTLGRFAAGALAWIVLGGIPRVIFFGTHDLGAVFDDLGPAIVAKHVVEVSAVVLGTVLWRRVGRQVAAASEDAGARGGSESHPL